MVTKSWALGGLIVLSGSLACAVAGTVTKSVSPAPPPIDDRTTGMAMVHVKGGCYQMGSTFDIGGPEEKPAHEVCLDDFYLGKHEVKQGQWKSIMGSNPSSDSSCGDDCPVDKVSWNDVQDFISRLNGRSGSAGVPPGSYRLPTEAEWEYAARSGGKHEKYSGRSDDLNGIAWYYSNSEELHPVGLKVPNGLGIHDMTGNVWEWTNDWYGSTYYSGSPRNNPTGPPSGDARVLRGGSFGDAAFEVRTSYRNYLRPDYRGVGKGFRLLRTAPAQAR
jgi:formylglycine-generating enzyme